MMLNMEQTMECMVGDKKLSGTYDMLVNNEDVFDIKTCKTWKLLFEPEMTDWHEQQNIYAWMLKKSQGISVASLNIIAIYLDWMEGHVIRSKKYPKEPVIVYPLSVWPHEKTEEFIHEKIDRLVSCEAMEDDELSNGR